MTIKKFRAKCSAITGLYWYLCDKKAIAKYKNKITGKKIELCNYHNNLKHIKIVKYSKDSTPYSIVLSVDKIKKLTWYEGS